MRFLFFESKGEKREGETYISALYSELNIRTDSKSVVYWSHFVDSIQPSDAGEHCSLTLQVSFTNSTQSVNHLVQHNKQYHTVKLYKLHSFRLNGQPLGF